MENLFHSPNLLDDMEESSKGIYDVQPRKTLRDRPYGHAPLIIKPDYSGDFLEKLKEPFEGKDLDYYAADSENLKDFTDPEEMLKHQEHPYPRVVLDDFYDINRPGEGAGGEDLKEYWDRNWTEDDSPEISEDKWLRMWTKPSGTPGDTKMASSVISSFITDLIEGKTGIRPSSVVASYLMNRFPIDALLNFDNVKVAKLLSDFENSLINGKKKLDWKGVNVRLLRAEPRVGRWTFATNSSGQAYTTKFEFIPHQAIRDTTKLHVRVSCSCPSWLFYGAQYHAFLDGYLYGKVRPVFAPPRVRDKAGTFLVCKHVLACIPVVSKYKLGVIPPELKKKIKNAPKYEVEKTEEVIRIPKDLVSIGKRSKMKKIMDQWENEPRKRKQIMDGITDPEEVAFLAFRFPSTATTLSADRLKKLSAKPALEKEALQLLDKVEEISGEPAKEVAMPPALKKFDSNEKIQRQLKQFDSKNISTRMKIIMKQTNPDIVAYLGYKHHDNNEIVSWVMRRLKELGLHAENPKDKAKAETWLHSILG
jgi:hypothetical protein